jgi:type IV pilus assembly protein PilQ
MSQITKWKTTLLLGVIAGVAHAAAGNELKAVKVSPSGSGVEVSVACSQAPIFNVFRLKDPDRLVVDVSNASVAGIKGHHDGAGPVTGIVASQFTDAKADVGRLLFGLDGARHYDVKAVDSTLVVSIEGAVVAPTAVSAASAADSAPEATATAAAAQPAHSTGETVIASRVDEKAVASPATTVKSVTGTGSGLRVLTNGEVARFEVIELADPPRLALDLFAVGGKVKSPRVHEGNVRDVRVGAHDGKTRIVVEFANRASFDVRRKADGVAVTFKAVKAEQTAQVAPKQADDADAVVEIDGQRVATEAPVAAAPQGGAVEVVDVKFVESAEGGALQLKLKGGAAKWTVERPDAKSAVLNLENARVAHQLERSLDTSALETPVKMVSVFAVPGAAQRVRVVVAAGQQLDQVVTERPNLLQWKFTNRPATEEAITQNDSAGFSTEASTVAEEGAPQQRRGYVGKRVSFEFKDIDIHNLLRIIAEISKKNIVVSDDVTGKVTVRLRNVPWDQALDLVLRSKGLGKEEFGNIIRVAPLDKLESESKSRAERRKNERLSRELSVALVPVNYATATDMASRVKEVLSERGVVTIDVRTNTLIVRDLPENMGKVKSLVSSLDLQTPQVLIESRIVEASTRFAREVGVQWGGQGALSPGTGNATGLAFPNTVVATGAVPGGNATGVSGIPNYAVSLPVGAGDGNGGALGLVFGSAGGAALLNLRLSALESNGSIKTISAPKVATLDNVSAKISQGVSIPFSQVSAAGANTAFIEARLSLDVKPHITQDASVLMDIQAENDQPDPSNSGANGQPGISRKQAKTTVLVKDGETTVIGGIYVRAGSITKAGLPILSQLPVIGFFFRNTRESETKNELLIFVTPRILNRAQVAQNQ